MSDITELARQSCVELFATYGADVAPVVDPPATPDRSWGCGIIGFTRDGAQGALVLVASAPLLDRSCPVAATCGQDWVGELANQLLGRLKNHLLGRGVEISLGTPTVLHGHDVAPRAGETRCVWFAGPAGAARLSLDLDLAHALADPHPSPTVREGEMVLF